ncbi:MAG: type II secretion system protein [Elusimicrobia bacterium]|nr:type II secretion system protein [Elusimicrobiota bacterium]
MRKNPASGFTLIEMLVVVLIIGILAALGIPQFMKSMEIAKADDALGTVQSIAAANKQFYIDHQAWATGVLNACSPDGSSPDSCSGANACDLMYCGYLARQDLTMKPYTFSSGYCGAPTNSGGACATRVGSTSATYNSWGYNVTGNGTITPTDTAGDWSTSAEPKQ